MPPPRHRGRSPCAPFRAPPSSRPYAIVSGDTRIVMASNRLRDETVTYAGNGLFTGLFRPSVTYVGRMPSPLKPREQGDLGEISAMEWLASKGARIYLPVGHSPDVDLIADLGNRVVRVEVKTSTQRRGDGRWAVLISTRGGNQSWTGLVKYFEPSRCDYLFAHVGDGRRWCIPTEQLECRSQLTLGGAKYAEFEIEPGCALAEAPSLESGSLPGERRRGRVGLDCKSSASIAEWVRIPPPPLDPPDRSNPDLRKSPTHDSDRPIQSGGASGGGPASRKARGRWAC